MNSHGGIFCLDATARLSHRSSLFNAVKKYVEQIFSTKSSFLSLMSRNFSQTILITCGADHGLYFCSLSDVDGELDSREIFRSHRDSLTDIALLE